MYSWNVGNLVVARSSDKCDGNILTVPQDLPACVVMMIVASGPVDWLLPQQLSPCLQSWQSSTLL